MAARGAAVSRIVLASSTSVWRDSPARAPARFVDEMSTPDATDAYSRSKMTSEVLLGASGIEGVRLRLARFAAPGDPGDDVRKLYRAIDPRDAADAVVLAIDAASPGPLYAIAAPTPFSTVDAALLGRDARAAIRARTGRDPAWAPERIGSVIVSERAQRELRWRCLYPSTLLGAN